MFNWLKKRRAFTLGQKAAGSQEPDAKAVAMFIVYNLLIHKTSCFSVPVERVAGIKAGLPDEVRRTFETWGPFYIAWRLIERSGERYGDVFRADVTALVPACIEPVRDKVPDTGEIIGYFRKIFDMMDQTRREGELVEIGGYQMPIVARVAMNLIILVPLHRGFDGLRTVWPSSPNAGGFESSRMDGFGWRADRRGVV